MTSRSICLSYHSIHTEILALDDNDAITGDATGICESANKLTTFAYGCEQVTCTGPCCHSECCGAGGDMSTDDTAECFSTLLFANLQPKDEEELHAYQTDRIYYAFSPSIIQHDST